MIKKVSFDVFIRNLEILIIIFSIMSGFISLLIWKNLNYTFSLLSGIFIAYLNFRSTKSDSIKTLKRVKAGLSPERSIFLYVGKFYLRIFATGILLYFFIKIIKLNAVFILLGLTIIYFQLILIALKNFYFKKLEII